MQDKRAVRDRKGEDGFRREVLLKGFESCLLSGGPVPLRVLLEQIIQRPGDASIPFNELPVVPGDSKETT